MWLTRLELAVIVVGPGLGLVGLASALEWLMERRDRD